MILNFLLVLSAVALTTLAGMPFVLREEMRSLTRIALSFAIGYMLLSTASIAGALLGIAPIVAQICLLIAAATFCVRFRISNRSEAFGLSSFGFDRDDWIVLGSAALYLIMGILFFDWLIMWMAGDAVAHAEMVRMLFDGQQLPVSLPFLGNCWEYYPKGFHYYAYLWAKAFPLINVIQTVPVLITAATPVLLYSIVKEMKHDASSAYVFLLASFAFSTHYSYLIWGGYPSAAAEMLLVAAVLAAMLRMRIIFLALSFGILLSHPRLLAMGIALLTFWILAEWLRKHLSIRYLSLISGGLLALGMAFLYWHRPEYLVSVFGNQDLASQFVARWYPALFALFGGAIAMIRQKRLDRLALAWCGSWILIALLADCGPLRFMSPTDRLLLSLYLPFSLLAGLALSQMDRGEARIKASFLLVLIIMGVVSTGIVLYSYSDAWGLPQKDYDAMMWLSKQNLSDAVCFNVDEIGAWIYPLTGIGVSCPRMIPVGFFTLSDRIRREPANRTVIRDLKSIGHQNILIYISSVSVLRPGHRPPFAGHSPFPLVNMSYPEEDYELIYENGAKIYMVKS